jgi:hypothetical protein
LDDGLVALPRRDHASREGNQLGLYETGQPAQIAGVGLGCDTSSTGLAGGALCGAALVCSGGSISSATRFASRQTLARLFREVKVSG